MSDNAQVTTDKLVSDMKVVIGDAEELLRATTHETTCPFKGQASYWSVQVGDEIHDDLVWSNQTPIPSAAGIAGLMCFYNDRVELTVDGACQPGPQTPSRQ